MDDNTRTPNLSPPAPLDGTYRYELIQNTGIAGDNTYYIDLWFVFATDPNQYADCVELKTGDRIKLNHIGEVEVIKNNKNRLKLVVNNG